MAVTGVSRCVNCYRIVEVQPMSEIFLQDEGIRDGSYFAVYRHTKPRPFCDRCRHRIAAMERLIGMWQRRGDDVTMMN